MGRRAPAPPAPAPPLHPVVRATGWVSFFTDLGSELIYPLLPDFVTGTLKASRRTFGLIEGLAEGMPSLVKLWSDALANRARSRKGLIFAGYLLSSAVKPFLGLAQSAGGVLGLRLLDKIGKGIRGAPRDAVVADFAGAQRGRAFGYQRAMDHAGAVAGGLLGFLLLRVVGVDQRLAIMLSAIPGLLALLGGATHGQFPIASQARRATLFGSGRPGGPVLSKPRRTVQPSRRELPMSRYRRLASLSAAALVLAIAAAALAQTGRPDPEKLLAAQRGAMTKLAMLDGTWRGDAWMAAPDGSRHSLTQTERVGPMLDGAVRVIEGRGYEADGTPAFHAFAVISFDVAKSAYAMRSYAMGNAGDFPVTITADGFQWEIAAGPMTIRYTAVVKDGVWTEKGTRQAPGQEPVEFFGMTLRRLGDTDWPAGGAVAP